jgi:hypothetical protein
MRWRISSWEFGSLEALVRFASLDLQFLGELWLTNANTRLICALVVRFVMSDYQRDP